MKNTIFMLLQTFRISRQLNFSFSSVWLSRPCLPFRFWPYPAFRTAKAAWDNRQENIGAGGEFFFMADAWHRAAFLRALGKAKSIKGLRILCFYCGRGSLLEGELAKKSVSLAKSSKDFYEISQNTCGQQEDILLPRWLEIAEHEFERIACLDDAKALYGYLPKVSKGPIAKVNSLRNKVFEKWCSFSSWELMKASGFEETKAAYDRAPERSYQKKEAYDACEDISFKLINEADGDMALVRSVIDKSIYLGSAYCLAFRILNSDIKTILNQSDNIGRLLSFFDAGSEADILTLENLSKVRPLLPPELPALIAEKHHLDNIGRLMFAIAFEEAFERELGLADGYEKKLALLPYVPDKLHKARLLDAAIPDITEAAECQRIYDDVLADLDALDKRPLKLAWTKISQDEISKADKLTDLFKALQSAPEELRFSENNKIIGIGYTSPFSQNLV